jgi:hypothetical protein
MSKEDKEDKEGIPIPPSKPKIWSMAELAVCKTPPLGSSLAAAASLVSGGGSGGGSSPWHQNGSFGSLATATSGLMRQNPAAVAAALRTTWNGMNLMSGVATTATSTVSADLSMALYPEMDAASHEEMAASGHDEMVDPAQAAAAFGGIGGADLRPGAPATPPSHTPPKLSGGGGASVGHHHHHHLQQQLATTINNNNSTHVIANAHGLQHFPASAYHHHHHQQSHHFSTASEVGMMHGGYLADRLKVASTLYEEDEEEEGRGKVPSLGQHGYQSSEGGSNSSNKMAASYEANMAMLSGSCYADRL